jgi:tRNA threonylcarbamoyladenosine biosynthesis protein TsaB
MSAFDRVLIIETAGKIGQVALADASGVVNEARLGEGRKRASDLALVVERLLRERDWIARDLTAVVVGLGPGSYTGLRVGLASAKALAYAVGCSFFGVETYAAIANRAPIPVREMSVIGDALQGKLFSRDYSRNAAGEWEPAGSLAIVPAADWLASLRPGSWVSGPSAASVAERLPSGVGIVEIEQREPRPADLLHVAQHNEWAVTTDMWTAEPFYLRGSSAEEKAALTVVG